MMASSTTHTDVTVIGGGTVYLLHLHTPEARDWVEEHIAGERQMLGEGLAVEHRYVLDVVLEMRADGLEVR